MSGLNSQPIKNRGIFFVGGFDPKSPEAFFARLRRETDRFEKLWDTTVQDGAPTKLNDELTLTSYVSKPSDAKEGWEEVKTDFHFLGLDDIVLGDFSQPFLTRLRRYVVTFSDYFFSGTAFAFFRHAWRFALYFCYPAFMCFIAILIGIVAASIVAFFGLPLNWIWALLAGVLTFWIVMRTLGERFNILHLMDLWSFSRDFVHTSRDDISNKLNRMADTIASQARANSYDEILLIGHSTGGALILDAAGRLFERHPNVSENCNNINVLTVGSTALKIGLHPAAHAFRARIEKLFSNSGFSWIEYQCLTDLINFYKTDPAKLMKIDGQPKISQIKIKNMVDPTVYKRIKKNFFRVHYQFVFGNTRKYHYDFPAICFGPASLIDRAVRPGPFDTSLFPPKLEKDPL